MRNEICARLLAALEKRTHRMSLELLPRGSFDSVSRTSSGDRLLLIAPSGAPFDITRERIEATGEQSKLLAAAGAIEPRSFNTGPAPGMVCTNCGKIS